MYLVCASTCSRSTQSCRNAPLHWMLMELTCWSFMRRDASSYVEVTRIAETPIAAAVLAPGNMRKIDINDLHVSLAHSHAATLRETARQMGIKVFGKLVSCAGCSEAKGRRMAVPWRPGAAPPGLCSVFSWIFRGSNRRLPAVLNTCLLYTSPSPRD